MIRNKVYYVESCCVIKSFLWSESYYSSLFKFYNLITLFSGRPPRVFTRLESQDFYHHSFITRIAQNLKLYISSYI